MTPYKEIKFANPLKENQHLLFKRKFEEIFHGLNVEEVLEIVKEKYPEKFI